MREGPPARRRGLGRGLDALLSPTTRSSDADTAAEDEVTLVALDLELVAPNPEQPRQDFDAGALAELAASIRTHGVLQPIVVERSPGGGYRLVAGERRLRAARLASLRTIPAIVRPAVESSRDALELALIENLQRADLSPLEEAVAFQRLSDTFGMTAEAIGLRVGRSRPAVANALRLLGLPPPVQEQLRARRLTAAHGRVLLGVEDDDARIELARRADAEQLTVRDLERLVEDRHRATAPGEGAPARRARHRAGGDRQQSAEDAALERGLTQVLHTPVRLERRGRAGGRLCIDFYDDAHLDGLYRSLGGPSL